MMSPTSLLPLTWRAMLKITIPARELYVESTNEFIYTEEKHLQLEHSLISLSKWESKWKKPFLSGDPHTVEESRDYARCMTLTQNVSPDVYKTIPTSVMKQITDYVDDPMTATTITDHSKEVGKGKKLKGETVTAELIYFWMVSYGIPFECEKWHLNRLLTLIQICNIKNSDPKKMSKRDVMAQNRALNQARRAKHRSKG